MATSLRKACHACARVKRRCIPQLPKCGRCEEKGISCTYDLEPVTNAAVISPSLDARQDSRPEQHQDRSPATSQIVFDSIPKAHSYAVHNFNPSSEVPSPPPPVVSNPHTFAEVGDALAATSRRAFTNQTSAFCHTLILSCDNKRLACLDLASPSSDQSVDTSTAAAFLDIEVQRLLSLDPRDLTFVELLANLHRLIAVILAPETRTRRRSDKTNMLLDPDSESLNHLFVTLTQQFYKILPSDTPNDLSRWHAWIVAETARRTIFAIIYIEGYLEVLRLGYLTYRPFVETLPFDARTGLWEANTEEEWLAAVQRHGGADSHLISWREFISCGGSMPDPEYDGILQRILLLGQSGSKG